MPINVSTIDVPVSGLLGIHNQAVKLVERFSSID